MPQQHPLGFVLAFFAVVAGFALIWHIWWMAIVGLVGVLVAALVARPGAIEREVEIPADDVAAFERRAARGRRVMSAVADLADAAAGRAVPLSRARAGADARSSSATASGCSCSATSSMFSALFAAYAVLSGQHRRRARRARSCSTAATC